MNASPPASLEEALRRALQLDGPLDARLAIIRDAYRTLRTPVAEAVDRLVSRLQSAAAGESAPRPGDLMPGFVLPDESGRLVSLRDLLRDGPVAIAFFRGHWCPFCRLGTAALHSLEAQLAEAGGRIVAITPERRAYSSRLKASSGATFPVLTDMDNGYALSLNLAVYIGAELQAVHESDGRDLPGFHGNAAWMLPIPATFIVGQDSIVSYRHVDPDYRRRIDLADLVSAMSRASRQVPMAGQSLTNPPSVSG